MIKAKEFWKYLCEELNYRFFAGVPCDGLTALYNKMDAQIMHYMPAVKESVALGLVNGARLASVKGCVLIDINRLYELMDTLVSFNLKYDIPIFIIAYCGEDEIGYKKILNSHKIKHKVFNGFTSIKYIADKSCVLILRKGDVE